MRFMPLAAVAVAASLIASCNQPETGTRHEEVADQATWQPAPVDDAVEPSETIEAAPDAAWREVAPENLLLMDLADGGRVAIELAPEFAPAHVAHIRALARAGWWNGAAISRVQDNYEIGSTSCRERGLQYVSTSVVAVPLKK